MDCGRASICFTVKHAGVVELADAYKLMAEEEDPVWNSVQQKEIEVEV